MRSLKDYIKNCSVFVLAGFLCSIGVVTASYIIPNGSVTKPKLASLGQQISSSSGSFSTSSASYVDVTNLSVSITTTGRPVWISLVADATSLCALSGQGSGGNPPNANFAILRGATGITQTVVTASAADLVISVPCSSLSYIDIPSSGTYTYKIQARNNNGASGSAFVSNAKLIVFEID